MGQAKKQTKHLPKTPKYLHAFSIVAIASIVWQVIYILLATFLELREKIISWGFVGSNCHGCEAQAYQSLLIVSTPLLIGSVGLGYAICKSLSKESTAMRIIIGTLLATAALGLSILVYLGANFAINFPA